MEDKLETKEHSSANLEVVIERLTNMRADNIQEHSQILEQVKKTNGTVADIQKWRYTANGALILLNIIIVPVVVAVLIKFLVGFF